MRNERKISLDTETTGFDPDKGDRIVEIGCVELLNDLPTGKKLHIYINPERDVPKEAVKVHGLTNEFLDDKPLFRDVADEFLSFIEDSDLIIHNAKFDMRFLNAELKKAGKDPLPMERAIDTLEIVKKRFPGSPMALDSLCRRFGVSLEKRELHGALLDAELLGEVWLGLNGGKQPVMDFSIETANPNAGKVSVFNAAQRPKRLGSRVSAEEVAAHYAVIEAINAKTMKATKGEAGAIWATPERADNDLLM